MSLTAVFCGEVKNMSSTVLYLILFFYVFITLHIFINSIFLLIIIIKRNDVRIISDSKKIINESSKSSKILIF